MQAEVSKEGKRHEMAVDVNVCVDIHHSFLTPETKADIASMLLHFRERALCFYNMLLIYPAK